MKEEQALAAALGLPPVVARVLCARGYHDPAAARAFLNPGLEQLPDPAALPDCQIAVARLITALQRRERILVHGDYDADGTSGAALLTTVLRAAGGDATPVVPDRRRDGYGLSPDLCRAAVADGATLVVTADVGSADAAVVAEVAALGLDVLVTDHHTMPAEIPAAVAVVNPRRSAEPLPLSGAGVAWMLSTALVARLAPGVQEACGTAVREAVELATLATIADVTPLTGANRALVATGLKFLESPHNPGLAALKLRARLGTRAPTVRDVSFQLVPRLNAVGRIDDPRIALDLLTTREAGEAGRLAKECDRANRRRQRVQRQVATAARAALDGQEDAPGWVVAGAGWHAGVIGIVAGRLCAEAGRPAFVIAIEGDRATGSSRGVPGADLTRALAAADDLLDTHGGHPRAAGFTLPAANVEALRRRLHEYLAANPPASAPEAVPVDADATLAELDRAATHALGRFAPFGEGNAAPTLRVAGGRRVGATPMVTGQGAFAKATVHLRDGDAVLTATCAPTLLAELDAAPSLALRWQHGRTPWRVVGVG